MQLFFVITIAAFVAIVLLMLGLSVKIILRKNGEFKRYCTSRDPYTGEQNCCICSKNSICNDKPAYSPLDVNQNLLNEIGE